MPFVLSCCIGGFGEAAMTLGVFVIKTSGYTLRGGVCRELHGGGRRGGECPNVNCDSRKECFFCFCCRFKYNMPEMLESKGRQIVREGERLICYIVWLRALN